MITILAATGFTGTLICEELINRGVDFQIAGRSPEKLQSLAKSLGKPEIPFFVVDVQNEQSYREMLSKTKVLINCAGPFSDLGLGIVKAVAERGIHYLDTTGEQSFIEQVKEKYGEIARANGAALIPACAFEYAYGDAGAALVANAEHCDEINIYYLVGGAETSRGTKKSILNALTKSIKFFEKGNYVTLKPGGEIRSIEFPHIGHRELLSFGGGEVITVPLHVKTDHLRTFISAGANISMLKFVLLVGVPLLKTPLRKLLNKIIDNQAVGPNAEERQKTKFTILCEAVVGNQRRRLAITGKDPYGLTGLIAADTAIRLLSADGDINGFTSAAKAFGQQEIKRLAEGRGVKWELL